MSVLSLPRPTDRPSRGTVRLTVALWVLARGAAVALARGLAWCAADPARPRAIVGGLALCTAIGAALGLVLGHAVAATVQLVTGLLPPTDG